MDFGGRRCGGFVGEEMMGWKVLGMLGVVTLEDLLYEVY